MENQGKKKIIIYDSTKDFYWLMRQYFSGTCRIDSVSDFKDPAAIRFEEYDNIFFIVNNLLEVFDLIHICPKVKPIFVGTRLSYLAHNLKNIDGIELIDVSQEEDIIELINSHLGLFAIEKCQAQSLM